MATTKESRDETPYRQCKLQKMKKHGDSGLDLFVPLLPQVTLSCWLPSAGLRKGMFVSLDGQEGVWKVLGVSKYEKPRYLLHTDWKVGGLK